MYVEGQHRHGDADDQEADENGHHDGKDCLQNRSLRENI
jgi:hypothetical protein